MSRAFIITDLGYGDAGKGTTVDYLAREYGAELVVRYNGGANAGHNVVTVDDLHHEFRQFGSGTLAGAATHLSKFVVVDPDMLFLEMDKLEKKTGLDMSARITIDPDCRIVTPWHIAINRIREKLRGQGRHGSTGLGIGETVVDPNPIRVRDLHTTPYKLRRLMEAKMQELRKRHDALFEQLPLFNDMRKKDFNETRAWSFAEVCEALVQCIATVGDLDYNRFGTVIFEGAQGVLLDEWRGFHPYTTWSKTTSDNARALLWDYEGEITRLGVTRTYQTRHGRGPFVTEDADLNLPEPHNVYGEWQEGWRQGHLDLVALRYAVRANQGIDQIVVTHADRMDYFKVCTSYQMEIGKNFNQFVTIPDIWWLPKVRNRDRMESHTKKLVLMKPNYEDHDLDGLLAAIQGDLAPIGIISTGPTANDKERMVVMA